MNEKGRNREHWKEGYEDILDLVFFFLTMLFALFLFDILFLSRWIGDCNEGGGGMVAGDSG